MKGTYASRHGHHYSSSPGERRPVETPVEPSKTNTQPLRWFDSQQRRGAWVALTGRQFAIGRLAFKASKLWKKSPQLRRLRRQPQWKDCLNGSGPQ